MADLDKIKDVNFTALDLEIQNVERKMVLKKVLTVLQKHLLDFLFLAYEFRTIKIISHQKIAFAYQSSTLTNTVGFETSYEPCSRYENR